MYKPKFFVRYMPGSSGHFVSLVLLSLITDVELVESHRAHGTIDKANFYHNWESHWFNSDMATYANDANYDIDKGIEFIKNNFFFSDENPYDFFVVNIHAVNPDAFLQAYDNTKLINISCTDQDLDQIAYNWVTKSLFLNQEWKIIFNQLKRVQSTGRLKHITNESLLQDSDIKLLTYIHKFSMQDRFSKYSKYVLPSSEQAFDIEFSSIANKKILDQLDELIKFVGVNVTPERKRNTIEMITRYANAQITVPWQLNLHDYD